MCRNSPATSMSLGTVSVLSNPLRYAFDELGLHRVTLSVFDYNLRAIRS